MSLFFKYSASSSRGSFLGKKKKEKEILYIEFMHCYSMVLTSIKTAYAKIQMAQHHYNGEAIQVLFFFFF